MGLLGWRAMSGYDIKKLVDMGLRHGVRVTEARVAWCDEVLAESGGKEGGR